MNKPYNEMTKFELIQEAGRLNNHPKLVNQDHVTFMGFLSRDESQTHVEGLVKRIGE